MRAVRLIARDRIGPQAIAIDPEPIAIERCKAVDVSFEESVSLAREGKCAGSVRIEDEVDGLTSRRPNACVRSPIGLRLDAACQPAADVPLLHRQDPQAVGSDPGLTRRVRRSIRRSGLRAAEADTRVPDATVMPRAQQAEDGRREAEDESNRTYDSPSGPPAAPAGVVVRCAASSVAGTTSRRGDSTAWIAARLSP